MGIETSQKLFIEAQEYIPGGVNSPVRAFKAVGGNPVFMTHAKGAYMYDEDGNSYIDLINSWGPMILGHGHPEIQQAVLNQVSKSFSFGTPTRKEVDIAKLICDIVPSIEKVRMVNSGTEATMSAVRLARGYTKRDKIIKFEGCYHGHGDSFLIAAGSGAITFGVPNSPGVPKGVANDTLTAKFNNIEEVNDLVKANKNQIAAIILEPVVGNMGLVLPQEGFLEDLRKICDAHDILLIFDEVMTGFRLSLSGAQGLYGVRPDLTTFGKIIGGGMPVGCYGGKREIMDYVSPQGPVYQAGTLSGNPIAMSSGLAMLNHLKENPEVYTYLNKITTKIVEGFKENLKLLGLNYHISQVGSMFCMFFTDKEVIDFDDAKSTDERLFGEYFRGMMEEGIYLPPSQYESLFVSISITDEIADKIITAHKKVLTNIVG